MFEGRNRTAGVSIIHARPLYLIGSLRALLSRDLLRALQTACSINFLPPDYVGLRPPRGHNGLLSRRP